MTNYICINGKKAELTEEQMKALGIELPKVNPFERKYNNGCKYYSINNNGHVMEYRDGGKNSTADNLRHEVANYCTDKAIMEQRALHETLNRLLWRYSMEHDGDKVDWGNTDQRKWYIFWEIGQNRFHHEYSYICYDYGRVYFYNGAIAKNAIEEIIEPFMKAHPEFKW